MHALATAIAPVLAAEKSHVPFYIAGGLLVVWALVLSLVLGMRRENFPDNMGGQRAIAGVSIVLVIAAMAAAVASSGGSTEQLPKSAGVTLPAIPPAPTGVAVASTSAGSSSGEAAGGAVASGSATASTGNPGATEFTQTCGACHTLKAAGTSGAVGPNLDTIRPTYQKVLEALKNGGLGSGTMPKNLYTGKEAEEVAKYVSESAGK